MTISLKLKMCVLFSLAFLFSCSEENLPSDNLYGGEPLANMQKPNPSNRIDMAEATNLVGEAIAFLDREHPSESKSSRAVNSVSILRFGDIKSSMMKSGEYRTLDISDTLAYVFNFGDSSGYVIISNDKRIESPLLAFTESGSLVNGETDNPGLKLFLERLEGYMLESIAKYGKTDEGKEVAANQKGLYLGSLDTVTRPLVTVRWGQKKPFNNNLEYEGCSQTSNGKVPAGCAATAVAQIMSYLEYPTSLGSGTSYSWTKLKKYKDSSDFETSPTDNIADKLLKASARAMVADLFKQIGDGVLMGYECTGSLTNMLFTLSFLSDIGFSISSSAPYPYDLATIKLGLNSLVKRPFIAKDCSYINGKCHVWVIDGLAKGSNNSNYYTHNNWGWDGDANGYYLSGVFDPFHDSSNFDFQNVLITRVSR